MKLGMVYYDYCRAEAFICVDSEYIFNLIPVCKSSHAICFNRNSLSALIHSSIRIIIYISHTKDLF